MFLITSVAILAIFVSLESLLESCNESRFCLIRSAAYKDKNNDMSKSLPLDIAGCFMATAVASRTSPHIARSGDESSMANRSLSDLVSNEISCKVNRNQDQMQLLYALCT